jgi:hypothetical protein
MGKLDQIKALGRPGIFDRTASVSRETKRERGSQAIENKGKVAKLTMADVLRRVQGRKSDRIA